MNKKETQNAIRELIGIYEETRETTPHNTAEKIISAMGTVKAGEAMAVLIKDCSWDGRISQENRCYWQKVKSWEKESESEFLGVSAIDRLHRAHLDQIAADLRKIHQAAQLTRDNIAIDSDMEVDCDTGQQITAYIETWFDVDRKFGLHISDEDDTWLNMYGKYNPFEDTLTVECEISREDGSSYFDYEPSDEEAQTIKALITEKIQQVYGQTPQEFCNDGQDAQALSYETYKKKWIEDHIDDITMTQTESLYENCEEAKDMSFDEYVQKHGFADGSCYVSFSEFCDNELALMQQENENGHEFCNEAAETEISPYETFLNRVKEIIGEDAEIDVSPDFQCDQTGGFPATLCVCWEKGKAWLELNKMIVPPDEVVENIQEYEQGCIDIGIRECTDIEQFNGILRSLGEDALRNAELFPEDESNGFVQKM